MKPRRPTGQTITLTFRDEQSFYDELRSAIKQRRVVIIETDYTQMEEVPQKLKDIFELEKDAGLAWRDAVTGAFIPGVAASPATRIGLNYKVLVIAGWVVAGAAVGGGAGAFATGGPGAPVGIAVGATLGLAVGTVSAALLGANEHKVCVEIDIRGRLKIVIEPK